MIRINEMPPRVAPALLEELAQCRTETIGHHRHWGFVHGAIAPVMPERKVVGTAVTIACPGHDSGVIPYLIGMLRPGDFICIDRLGDNHNSCWGGGTTLAAQVNGAVGLVIDGPSTGSSKFREYDLPAWIRGYTPITCHPYGQGGGINIPISVSGAVILPGYAILADESGVVALPPEDVPYLVEGALQKQAGQPASLQAMRDGLKPADRLGIKDKIEQEAAKWDEARQEALSRS